MFTKLKTISWRSAFLWISLIMPYGLSAKSSYPIGPRLIQSEYHMLWMWRNSELASTNHSLSYAKSKDLKTWTSCEGTIHLNPIDISKELIVEKGLLINGAKTEFKGLLNSRQNFAVFNGKTVISYIVNNERGTQVVNATQSKNCEWNKQYVTNNCEYIDLDRYGTLPDAEKIKFTAVYIKDGQYIQRIHSSLASCDGFEQSGVWVLDDSFAKVSISKQTKHHGSKDNAVPLRKPNKTLQTKNFYIQWHAKQNNGDSEPSCIYLFKCSINDFRTPIIVTNKKTNYQQSITDIQGNRIFAWGGSKADFSAIELGDAIYLTYYDRNHNVVISKIVKGKVAKTINLAKANDIWDSHNNLVSKLHDDKFFITGNIHNDPLTIFVLGIDEMIIEKVIRLDSSSKVSYPKIFNDEKSLKIMFRIGKSGDGKFYIANLNKDKIFDIQQLFSN
jgi:hypothetical protein